MELFSNMGLIGDGIAMISVEVARKARASGEGCAASVAEKSHEKQSSKSEQNSKRTHCARNEKMERKR